MTNADRILENYANCEHRLLGRTLKPFCLLHRIWLESLGSPLFFTDRVVTLADLEIASLVCSSSSSDEIQRKLTGKNRRGLKRISDFFRRWRHRETSILEAIKTYADYVDDYCGAPEFFGSDRKETNERIPINLHLASFVIKQTGWPEDVVLTLPFGKVLWYFAAFSYLETGDTGVLSDKDRRAISALEELTGAKW